MKNDVILLCMFVLLLLLAATIGGFFVWLLWPIVIPAVFPGLVASGTIAAELSFLQSVALSWLCAVLFKTTSTSKDSQ